MGILTRDLQKNYLKNFNTLNIISIFYSPASKVLLDSNIDSKSTNNTYLNIIELLFLLLFFYFLYELHRMRKFGSKGDFRKVDFLSAEKINHRSRFLTNVNNENINV